MRVFQCSEKVCVKGELNTEEIGKVIDWMISHIGQNMILVEFTDLEHNTLYYRWIHYTDFNSIQSLYHKD